MKPGVQSLGGKARAAKLSPEERRAIAAKGGKAQRGGAKPPKQGQTFHLPVDLLARVDAKCARLGLARVNAVTQALEEWLAPPAGPVALTRPAPPPPSTTARRGNILPASVHLGPMPVVPGSRLKGNMMSKPKGKTR